MLNKTVLLHNLIPYRGIKYYSSVANESLRLICAEKLDPYFVTGLTEAEGSFSCEACQLRRHEKIKIIELKMDASRTIGLRFKITMLSNELTLLNQVQSYFGIGKIYVCWQVSPAAKKKEL